MDGYAASAKIRAMDRPDAKTTAIIALTANAFMDDITKATKSGMNGHIAKPVDYDKLIATILKNLDVSQKPD
jgi:CheY-like chemotaxis protein